MNFLFLSIEPGVIEFEEPITLVKESVGKAEIKLIRVNGADGRPSVRSIKRRISMQKHQKIMKVRKRSDRSNEYLLVCIAAKSEIVFEHGEISKIIAIPIMNDLEAEKDESFSVELTKTTGGAQLGKHTRTVVTIINDDGTYFF